MVTVLTHTLGVKGLVNVRALCNSLYLLTCEALLLRLLTNASTPSLAPRQLCTQTLRWRCVLLYNWYLRLLVIFKHFSVCVFVFVAATSTDTVLDRLHILKLIIYLLTSIAFARGGLYWFLICKWFSDVFPMFLFLLGNVSVALAARRTDLNEVTKLKYWSCWPRPYRVFFSKDIFFRLGVSDGTLFLLNVAICTVRLLCLLQDLDAQWLSRSVILCVICSYGSDTLFRPTGKDFLNAVSKVISASLPESTDWTLDIFVV